MSVTETGAVAGRTESIFGRLGNAWPLIGIGIAVAANAVWIGFLIYGLSMLL
jgi:hypothetical protein